MPHLSACMKAAKSGDACQIAFASMDGNTNKET
ncbi:hypothetical protein AVEN_60054-1, partial [Araneus ventricosus]